MSDIDGRKLVVIEYISLDGVIQGPGHAWEDTAGGFELGGWSGPWMAEHRRYNSELFQAAGAFLLGRVTYEIFAEYWPTVTDEADEIAKSLNSKPKYVASKSLESPSWEGTTVLRDAAAELPALKNDPGKPIFLLGSSALAQSLGETNVIDEYQLWIHPVVLGSGKRLFANGLTTELRLIDSRTSAGGLCVLTFETRDEVSKEDGNEQRSIRSGRRCPDWPRPRFFVVHSAYGRIENVGVGGLSGHRLRAGDGRLRDPLLRQPRQHQPANAHARGQSVALGGRRCPLHR